MNTQRYALLGWPVAHSVSPPMQEAAFRACGIDAVYELHAVPAESFAEKIDELIKRGYAGWNVTVPHKERMAARVDDIDPTAALADSVNTVRVEPDGRLRGWSTDGYGLEAAVREAFGMEPPGLRVVILGAGGAARAVAVHFARRGVASLAVANRTRERARDIAVRVRKANSACTVLDLPLDPHDPDLRRVLLEADLVVQATSLGLHPDDPAPLPASLLRPGTAVLDMIYHPTRFMAEARAAGCRVTDGRGMLLHQGARSFEFWTGLDAPVEAMRKALERALEQRRNHA